VLATGILATMVFSGCGGDDSTDSGLGASDSPVVTKGDDPVLTCPGSDATFSTGDADSADCDDPSPQLKSGLSWVTVVGTPAGVDADETSFEISVAQRDCGDGSSPKTLHAPFVVQTDDSVTLYMTMDTPPASDTSSAPPTSGDASDQRYCEGNPVVYGTVDLGEKLGQRAVYDGSTWPPTKLDDAPTG
jgi:hypothetical protein